MDSQNSSFGDIGCVDYLSAFASNSTGYKFINRVAMLSPTYFKTFRAGIKLVVLTSDDYESAVDVMSKSFSGTMECGPEPITHWMMGYELCDFDDERRLEITRHQMGWYFSFCLNYGVCFGILDESTNKLTSVLCAMHPGSVENGIVDTPWRNLMTSWRVGSPPYVAKPANYAENDIGAKVDARVKAFGDYVSTLHREYATTNHWYVQILAVHPDHQGKGYSRLLLDFISANADVDNVICYLESFGEKSKSVYEKHGYELQSGNLCEIHVKNDEYEKFSDVGGAFIRFPTQTPE